MEINARKRKALKLIVTGFFIFLYLPIIVLIVFSFNKSSVPYEWAGFSLCWYKKLFSYREAWQALLNSMIVACSTVICSITLAVWLVYYSSRRMRRIFLLFYGSLIVPEIVLSVGLLGFFSLFSVPLGFVSLIAGHTLLGLGYAVPVIYARFCELEAQVTEASLDLGASHTQTFFRVILPLLIPSIIAAALLIFVISLDDFLIAFFCAGAETQTLPLYIFSVVRSGGSPMINALSTILLAVGGILIVLATLIQTRKNLFLNQ